MQIGTRTTSIPVARDATGSVRRLRVGGNFQSANLINEVNSVYPVEAKAASLAATIGTDGAIQSLNVIAGDPLLVPASLEAVRQWIYRPTLLNGQPVEVDTQVDINFTLAQ